jgi:hypothetical protein
MQKREAGLVVFGFLVTWIGKGQFRAHDAFSSPTRVNERWEKMSRGSVRERRMAVWEGSCESLEPVADDGIRRVRMRREQVVGY